MITYYMLGGGKRLCGHRLRPGSHDAGITGGDANVQTPGPR